ncbi:MAG TPA: imidazolonepropionase [Planctomycetota bacterium]|nr:imidazolonepropionase [Planctomycetota bacterium]
MPRAPADLLVVNAGSLVTMAGPARPRVGSELSSPAIVDGGAVAIRKGRILAVGTTGELRKAYAARRTIDAKGALVTPGLVDPHTHLVFMGSREGEFEMRAAGKTYMEIAQAGGGIHATVERVRAASKEELVRAGRPRVRAMLEHGTTTVEAKSGYGLTLEDEVKSLEAIRSLGCVPTFLGAHEVPRGKARADYVREVAEVMVPRVRGLARHCDVFCEVGVFSTDDARRILQAAKDAGMSLKMHAEEFRASGGAELAAELGAVSADHLMAVTDRGIRSLKRAGTVAVLLPGTSCFLGGDRYAPARRMIEEGVAVALGTDFNPGSCPAFSLPLIMSLAVTHLRMSPAEALAASTINAAYACGEGEEAGSLEPGKRADLVVWKARDFREIPYWIGANLVARVIRAGKLEVDR